MPNVSIFAPKHVLENEEGKRNFISACDALCTGEFKAEPDKVHIIFVAIDGAFHGRQGYIEIKCRANAYRTDAVVNSFIAGLEEQFIKCFDVSPRIRCFSYEANHIHALN